MPRARNSGGSFGWLRTEGVQRVFAVLGGPDAQVYAVGGAVRDSLAGLCPTEVDFATSLQPNEVMRLAAQAGLSVHPSGISHGTVTLGIGKTRFEVTTLRRDAETFGRRARVAFDADLLQDARRRDFTVNALYCDAHGLVLDPLGGRGDIQARRVRFIGDPLRRIAEDHLRILRFFRIHARFGHGDMDSDGLAACAMRRDDIRTLSPERLTREVLALIVASGAAAALQAMHDHGLLAVLEAGSCRFAHLEQMIRIDRRRRLTPDPLLRLAVFCGPDAGLLRRLRWTKAQKNRLKRLTSRLARPVAIDWPENRYRALLYKRGIQDFRDALRLAWSAAAPEDDQAWARLWALARRWRPPVFPVSGHDLIATGISPGPAVGHGLAALEKRWVAEEFPPGKSSVLKWLKASVPAAGNRDQTDRTFDELYS